MIAGVTFEDDDGIRIKDWDLSRCGLVALPESFGSIKVGRELYLSSNQLVSLPESVGSITVGGNLHLYDDRLVSSPVPESF